MNNKELKHLNRRELVDIIYQLKKNEQEMQEEIKKLKEELQDKRIGLSQAGSIADAAMSVTDVFAVAQKTADIYLNEILIMKEDTEKKCAEMIEEAEKKVEKILSVSEKRIAGLKELYENEYLNWQQFETEIVALEESKNQELCEDTEDDCQT